MAVSNIASIPVPTNNLNNPNPPNVITLKPDTPVMQENPVITSKPGLIV